MGQFYKKYHRLFTDFDEVTQNKNKKLKIYQNLTSENSQYFDQKSYPQKQHMNVNDFSENKSKIRKSPALDEFEINVLPYIKSKNTYNPLDNLKQQMKENTQKLKLLINEDKRNQFYQLPMVNKHQRTKTLPQNYNQKHIYVGNQKQRQAIPLKELKEHHLKDSKENKYKKPDYLSHNIEELEKQYMKNSREAQNNMKINHLQKINKDMINLNQPVKKNHIENHTHNLNRNKQQLLKINEQNKQSFQKKWEIKILPFHQRTKINKQSPQFYHKNIYKPMTKNRYQQQLYGLNSNPYAFANTKLTDIKKIQRYLPYGFVNTYTQCLYRRKQCKLKLHERRNKLKALLQNQY